MQKIFLLSLLGISILGCTKKSSNSPAPSQTISIAGNWVTNADTLRIYQNGTLKETDSFTGNPAQLFNYRFNADGTVVFITQSDTTQKATGTYSINNNVITFVHPTQTVNGMVQTGYSQNATIRQHTSNSLVIFFDDSDTSAGITERDTEVQYMTK